MFGVWISQQTDIRSWFEYELIFIPHRLNISWKNGGNAANKFAYQAADKLVVYEQPWWEWQDTDVHLIHCTAKA